MKRSIHLVCAAWLGGAAVAAPPADVAQRIRQFEQGLAPAVLIAGETPKLKSMAERMAELKVPGVSVAVIHQGRIDWARGYGVTRIDGPSVTEKSLFQAASISKPVFAMAVLHLVDQGKLKLDANVNDYLKTWKLPDNGFTATEKVTLRRLLSHSAGLTVHGFPGYAVNEKVPTMVQILDGVPPAHIEAIRVDIAPGSRHRYSGGGYTVAQLVLTDVTGTPLPQLMQDYVLKPLGMMLSTYEQPLPAMRIPEVALPYRGDGNPVGPPHTYPEMAAAGLWTTPSDLARYALGVREALAGKSKVIAATTARAMLTPVIDNQGIGPQLGGSTPRKYFMHGGSNVGYQCFLVAYEDGEGAVVMTNSDSGGYLMFEVLRTISHIYGWPDFNPPTRKLASVKPAVLDSLIGAYRLDENSVFLVRKQDDTLVGHVVGNRPAPLAPSSGLELFALDEDMVATFTAAADGRIASVRHRLNGWERSGPRMAESEAHKVLAGIERTDRRIKEQKADPRSEDALRELIGGLVKANPNYDRLTPQMAEITRQELPRLQQIFAGFGALKNLKFMRVTDSGADEYDADFENAALKLFIFLNEEGRILGSHFERR